MTIQLALLVVLLLFSAFFSGSETAFFSLNHFEKDKLLKQVHGRRRRFISGAIRSPAEILITILTGNMVVNLFFASIMDVVVGEVVVHGYSWLYSIFIGTILLLIFGEMTPKNLAIRHSLPFFRKTSGILQGIHFGITPVRLVLRRLERGIVDYLSGRVKHGGLEPRNLISSTAQIGVKKGIIQYSELRVLESFLDFREKTAEDIMIPRPSLHAVETKTTINRLLSYINRNRNEDLLAVYRDNIDRIIGYVQIRDLLPYRDGATKTKTIARLIRPIHPVPETKNLTELLREMMALNCEMALVVDEYGGTAGIVTYRQLVADVLYFFYPTKDDFTKVAEGIFRFPGHFELDRVEEILGVSFESENRTISGFLTEKLEEIPPIGTQLRFDGYVFVVKSVSKKRVLEVEARKVS